MVWVLVMPLRGARRVFLVLLVPIRASSLLQNREVHLGTRGRVSSRQSLSSSRPSSRGIHIANTIRPGGFPPCSKNIRGTVARSGLNPEARDNIPGNSLHSRPVVRHIPSLPGLIEVGPPLHAQRAYALATPQVWWNIPELL